VSGALRDAAVNALAEAFAQDALSVEEFERRVELAHRAETEAELRVLLGDLPSPELRPAVREPSRSPAAGGSPGTELAPGTERRWELATHVAEQAFVVGVLGGGVRKGRWHPARYNYAIGVLGGVDLDLRECALPPEMDIRCFTLMGGVSIIVPPDVVVVNSGVGIMGGFDEDAVEASPPPGAPVIRITGVAVMGGVSVKVRRPGESEGDTRRGRREEKRERKRLRRGG